ncbi:UDP-N-acetylglucosamine 2-epimerase (non-hydrolyzing) [candidate division KSB1 bacterium]|nr:UDP-N-acetylglucosamine 2-epimerase (non-hydrolyzing) [candidate division KSB1 bacterium]
MKIATIVGARPQFIKAAPLSRVLRQRATEFLIHTGQHYDANMSQVFFDELGIPAPDLNLEVGSASHAVQTGEILIRLEKVLLDIRPDLVLVYGDTNSTLAAALAATKLQIPVAHVEAGLRSFNRKMPEEINRIWTDKISDLLFCPTRTAVQNLQNEGIETGVHLVGDVMYDAALQFGEIAAKKSRILEKLSLVPKKYFLATVHRPFSTDSPENLRNIIEAFNESQMPVIFPVHPRTVHALKQNQLWPLIEASPSIIHIDPVSYLEMLVLEKNAAKILTDSGGIQKEAYFFQVPCITLREDTEWVETVADGWNILVGTDKPRILAALKSFVPAHTSRMLFGDGKASEQIVKIIFHSISIDK